MAGPSCKLRAPCRVPGRCAARTRQNTLGVARAALHTTEEASPGDANALLGEEAVHLLLQRQDIGCVHLRTTLLGRTQEGPVCGALTNAIAYRTNRLPKMGIALSKMWERLFSGKNYKIIILGAMSRRSSPSCLLCRYLAPSPRGRGMAKAVAGGSAVSSPLHGAPPGTGRAQPWACAREICLYTV